MLDLVFWNLDINSVVKATFHGWLVEGRGTRRKLKKSSRFFMPSYLRENLTQGGLLLYHNIDLIIQLYYSE